MTKKPGIDRRIGKLAALLPGDYTEDLVQAVRELVSSHRVRKPKKATREMAKGLLGNIMKTEEALGTAKGYILACLTSKEAVLYAKPKPHLFYEKEEEAAGDQGC
jgi:hypothetical protein